jgi:AhpD family alkylhydroperoxidase
MKNPAMVLPESMPLLQALGQIGQQNGAPSAAVALATLRASQINGCSFCVDLHSRAMKQSGDSDERIFAVSAWRESPHFSEAERAALALGEAITRIADQSDPVPDSIWAEAARHFTEPELASLILAVGVTNLYNRINVTIRQPVGAWKPVEGTEAAPKWSPDAPKATSSA